MLVYPLSIIVLNFNTRPLLSTCLRSIQDHAPQAEVIVVDNGSTDGSAAMVAATFPAVTLLANPKNVGFARGMNRGLRAAQGAHWLCLNADTELLADTLGPLQAALTQGPRVGMVGPAQFLPAPARPGLPGLPLASAFEDPTLAHEAARLLLLRDAWNARLRRGPWQPPVGPPRQVDWLMGAALLARRDCLEAVGGFDETEFMYGEDWDVCYRARQAGWQVLFVPQARLIHHENAAGRAHFGPQRAARVLRANLYYHEKHFGRRSRRSLARLYLVGGLLRLALLWPARAGDQDARQRWQAQRAELSAAWAEVRGGPRQATG